MQNIKNIFILVFSFVFMTAHAQKPAAERADARTKIMTCELKLTAESIPHVYELNLRAAKRMDSIFAKFKDNQKLIDKYGREVDKKYDIELRSVLSSEQYSLYMKIKRGTKDALKKTENCRPK